MKPLSKPLKFYVDKLKSGEKFSLARYGDGELYCMWGARGANSNKCRYTDHLRHALLDSMKHWEDPTFIYGLQRVLPQDEARVLSEYPNVQWYDSEIFSEAVAKGELYPLIEALRERQTIVVGNESIMSKVKEIFNPRYFIEVPPFDAFEERERVLKALEQVPMGSVVLFSCGMAANAFIAELHGKVDAWLIDLGHIWDPFTGNMSRCDLEGKTLEDINKNLHAPTNQ